MSLLELAELGSFEQRARRLVEACRSGAQSLRRPDPAVLQALTAWSHPEHTPFPRVSALTRESGLSERTFERRFLAQVGLRPVGYRRLARFRSVLRLHAAGARDWAALAAHAGYSDQSHLVRDFRGLAGVSPTQWAAAQRGPAGFLQDGQITHL